MIITFEGGEGVGKTTQAALLKAYLESQDRPVIAIREPGGSPLSEKIRTLFLHELMDPLSELLLVLAARLENIIHVIKPALAAGTIVIIDRFIDSTLVYQGIAGGLGLERVKQIMQATDTWLEPDLTFVLDLDPALAAGRYTAGDRFERQNTDYHKRLRAGFLAMADEQRHHILDTALPKEIVFDEIRAILLEKLNPPAPP